MNQRLEGGRRAHKAGGVVVSEGLGVSKGLEKGI